MQFNKTEEKYFIKQTIGNKSTNQFNDYMKQLKMK